MKNPERTFSLQASENSENLREISDFENRNIEYEKNESEIFKDVTYYLNAGGLGTRLEPVLAKDEKLGIIKALVNFANKPIVNHLERAMQLNFGKIIIAAGHHQNIREYLIDNEKEKSQKFEIIANANQYGTGGDLILAVREHDIGTPYIFVQNVDTLLDVEEAEVIKQHTALNSAVTIVLTSKKNVPNEGAYLYDDKGTVVYSAESSPQYQTPRPTYETNNGSSTGTVLINAKLLKQYDWHENDGPPIFV